MSGSYKRVERIGIAIGLLELLFIPAAFMGQPDARELSTGMLNMPVGNSDFLFLLAANIGAVIMPWMVFYQQGAVIDKHLKSGQIKFARWDTLIGAILTQLIMLSVVIATASTIGKSHPDASLNTIQEISGALEPAIGTVGAKVFFGLGMVGAAFLAALVVSLAGAKGIGEAFGFNHSLNLPVSKEKLLYSIFTLAHVAGRWWCSPVYHW